MNKVNEIVNQLNTLGYYKTNVSDVLDGKGIDLFNNNIDFFNNMLNDEFISQELQTINTNPNDRFERSGGKPFEITHYHYLKKALSLNDGSFIKLYIDDFFTEVATKFLGTSPQIFNVLAWLHSWNNNYGRMHSQNWHRDREDFKLLKIFMYYSDVDESTGPFQYVPKSFCGGDFETNEGKTEYWDYASDNENRGNPTSQKEVELCDKNFVSFTGKVGDIIMVNNSGFHRGGFVSNGVRVASHCLYIRPDAYMIEKDKYFTSFNFNPEVNYIDFESQEFLDLGEKQKYFKR